MSQCISTFYISMKDDLDRMLKTLYHFHPEANVDIINSDKYYNVSEQDRRYIYPYLGKELSKTFKTVTHIDADVLIVDRLDELFDENSDIRAGRNNSDNNMAGPTKGIELPGIGWTGYVNAGIHSVTGESFWNDWYNTCHSVGEGVQFGEQGVLNGLFYSSRYNSKLLDPIESSIHYGTSFQEGDWNNYFISWSRVYVAGDHLEINGKRIKMFHMANGAPTKPNIKDLFSKEVYEYIMELL